MPYVNRDRVLDPENLCNIGTRNKPVFLVDRPLSFWFLPSKFTVKLSTMILVNGSLLAFAFVVLGIVLMIQADTRLSLQASARCQVKQERVDEMKLKLKDRSLGTEESATISAKIKKLESELLEDRKFLSENYKARIKPHLYFAKQLETDELEVEYSIFSGFDIWFWILAALSVVVWITSGKLHKIVKYPNDSQPPINLY